MIQLSDLKNNKVAILGFGLEGQATADFLSNNGVDFAICDKLDLDDFIRKFPKYSNHNLYLGQDYLESLGDFDYVYKTPGISPLIKEIEDAKTAGTIFSSQIELFLDLAPTKNIIGVTGTKGKGTTSTLIYKMLKAGGKEVYLGGNIGIPAISFINELSPNSWVVLELSSFQLQALSQSPHMAVVLNITSEHLDYHKDTDEYRSSKANLVRYQSSTDIAIINIDYDVPLSFASITKANKYFFSRHKEVEGCFVDDADNIVINIDSDKQKLLNFSDLKLRGRHNLENVTAATAAAFLSGVGLESIRSVLSEFRGLEHRLELVSEIAGVKYYDDSFSTVPETAIAAINSFSEPIILIAGGSNKNSNYSELGKQIVNSNIKKIILIGDTASDILRAIPEPIGDLQVVTGLSRMEEIVKEAASDAKNGDVVLLSPACASFGLFENYKDRGDQFKYFVGNLK